MKKHSKSIFIFRRDLRLQDNTTLDLCCENSEKVLPIFIFDPKQAKEQKNEYFSNNAFQFLIESLESLDADLKNRGSALSFFQGDPTEVVGELMETASFEAVYFNYDHTPYSRKRDVRIRKGVEEKGGKVGSKWDALLTEPGTVLTNENTPYQVFTPFKRSAMNQTPNKPIKNEHKNFYSTVHETAQGVSLLSELLPNDKRNENLAQKPGREKALEILSNAKDFENYDEAREYPAKDGTTHLSGHLKFGTISPREAYWQFRNTFDEKHGVINEFYWRDFYAHLLFHYPKLLGKEMKEKYGDIKWSENKEHFEKWRQGKTGFPIVDAAMRQLNTTGWMHNRMRMTVASFLTKDLHLDWRWGEKYFAQMLLDYDPANNNGGWQWAASTGADAQPYFRIFNPWSQQKKYDPDAEYIRNFVPELRGLSPKEIHDIEKTGVPAGVSYPEVMVDHKKERQEALDAYKSVT